MTNSTRQPLGADIAESDEGRFWSTASAPPGHELSYWTEAVAEALVRVSVSSTDTPRFQASLWQGPFGPARLSLVRETVAEVRRTSAGIARATSGEFYLLQHRAGEGLLLEQRNESQVLRAYDCALVKADAPYRLAGDHLGEAVLLTLPSEYLRLWLPDPDALAGRVFPAKTGWGAALSAAFANLGPDWPQTLSLPAGMVADQLLALLALAAGKVEARPPHQEASLRRIRNTLRERLSEPGLDPESIAAQHKMSKRHLHTLFAGAGTSFGRTLLAIRLEEAKRLLDDTRFARLGITEIALRCGFAEPSHFARRFRERYGASPADYRKQRHS